MCDYSLCGLPNRLAAEGEELVVHRFRTGTMGLASPADLSRPTVNARKTSFWEYLKSIVKEAPVAPAICIPPGAQLVLRGIPPELQRRWKIGAEEPVCFTQLSANVNTHRDAVRFRNGTTVLLQFLAEGIRADVCALAPMTAEEERAILSPVL